MRLSRHQPFQNLLDRLAPKFFGAFFVAGLLLTGVSCGKKGGTADWDTPGSSTPEATRTEPAIQAPVVSMEDETAPDFEPMLNASQHARPQTDGGLRFITYNVENWLTMDRYVGGKNLKGAPKPE